MRERNSDSTRMDKNGQEWVSLNCVIFGLAVLSKKSLMAAQPLASVFGRSSNRAVQADPFSPVFSDPFSRPTRFLDRLPDRAPAPRPGTGGPTRRMDALELPRDPGHAPGYHEPFLAEKDRRRPGFRDIPKWPPNGPFRRQNPITFLADTEIDENVRAGPVPPAFPPMTSRLA